MEVEILCRKLVKPSSPTPYHDHLRTYKLSFFDQLAPRYHLPYVYFYAGAGQHDNHHLTAEFGDKLEKSLSDTLTHFPFLAGRFAEDGVKINCDDQGVEYTRAHINIQLDEYLRRAHADANLMNHFVSWDFCEPLSEKTPLLCIQVTTFDYGGLALTLNVSHIVCDAFSCNTFLNAWATMNRQGASSFLFHSPSIELGSVFPARKALGYSPTPVKIVEAARMVSKIFVFDEVAISKLKKEASSAAAATSGKSNVKIQPSKVGVVIALIWRSLICVNRAKHGRMRSSTLSLAVNLRGRTATPTPPNGFGNLVAPVPVKLNASGKETRMELHELIKSIKDAVHSVESRFLKAVNVDDVFGTIIDLRKEIGGEFVNGETDFYICTSWCRFPFYEADFGWGKPCWVSGGNPTVEMVLLMDTKCGTGIEAKVSLNQRNMDAFQSHPDIIAFTTTSSSSPN